jgi:hypothetical protein
MHVWNMLRISASWNMKRKHFAFAFLLCFENSSYGLPVNTIGKAQVAKSMKVAALFHSILRANVLYCNEQFQCLKNFL